MLTWGFIQIDDCFGPVSADEIRYQLDFRHLHSEIEVLVTQENPDDVPALEGFRLLELGELLFPFILVIWVECHAAEGAVRSCLSVGDGRVTQVVLGHRPMYRIQGLYARLGVDLDLRQVSQAESEARGGLRHIISGGHAPHRGVLQPSRTDYQAARDGVTQHIFQQNQP